MLNRGVVMVSPKQPYLNWAAGLDDSGVIPPSDGEKMVFLIPQFETEEDAWEILKQGFEAIFAYELWAWHLDPSSWPQNRTFQMFQEWFHIEFGSEVMDLCNYEIEDDDDDLE